MRVIFVDSNVLVYSQVERLPECAIASAKIRDATRGGQVAVNAVVVSEFFYVLGRFLGAAEAARSVGLFLESSSVIYLTIEKSTMINATKLAAAHSRAINDMIIAQHTIDAKAEGLLTDNSRHFEGISNLKTIALR